MTEEQARQRFQDAVRQAGGVRAFARKSGLSASYVSDIRRGHRALSVSALQAIGLERIVTVTVEYCEIDTQPDAPLRT